MVTNKNVHLFRTQKYNGVSQRDKNGSEED